MNTSDKAEIIFEYCFHYALIHETLEWKYGTLSEYASLLKEFPGTVAFYSKIN